MALRNGKSLGIALGARSFYIAEIAPAGEKYQISAHAEFVLGEGDSLQDPATLGKKLEQCLKQNRISANAAVFGIPAQWLMLKEKSVPPAAPELLNSMLLIQAECDFSLEPSALCIDYVSGKASSDGQPLVLAATLTERIEQIQKFAAAAGLKIQAITSTTLALASAAKARSLLYFGANGAEMVSFAANGLPRLRHVASGSLIQKPGAQQLAGELRRGLVMSQQEGLSEIALCDDAGLDHAVIVELEAEIKVAVRKISRFSAPVVDGVAELRAAGAVALALCRIEPALEQIDFAHSRLAVKPKPKLSARLVYGGIAAVLLLGLFGYLIFDWRQSAAEVAELRERRDDMKENVDAAKMFISQVNATATWYERRPNYLECLRAITLCFPEEGKVWSTNVSLREDMRGLLSGRAVDEKFVLDVLDKMKSSGAFSDVKMLQMRSAGARGAEFSFGISFVFLGAK